MIRNNAMPCAVAILASLSLAACSTSRTDGPTPTDVSTATVLAPDVVTALTVEEDDTASGVAVTTALQGAADAPVLSDTTYTVDGVEYTVIEANDPDDLLERGDLFAVEVASVDGVKAIATGEFGIRNEQGSDADRVDILFSAAPTDVADLPTSTASYVGTFEAVFSQPGNASEPDGSDSGVFTATADFGTEQTLTGSFLSPDNDGVTREQAVLNAEISGNTFSGTISTVDSEAVDNEEVQIGAAGYFTGDNASGVVGAGAGTFDGGGDPEGPRDAVVVFEGTAE